MSHDSPSWKLQFASDNTAAITPEAWEWMRRANEEPQYTIGYGDDPITERAVALIRALFETDCEVFFVFNGSAANSLALSAICNPYHGILCHPISHAETDEANAPEFFTGGAKLIHIGGEGGKMNPALIGRAFDRGHGIHSSKIRALTITNATEVGTVYTPDQIREIATVARREGRELKLHMDGARFANAVASLGVSPADLSWRAGVDVLTFGGTKNGCPGSEALVFFDKSLSADFEWRRKQGGQLASKMRYLSAPWIGMLEEDGWLRHARRANAAARRLAGALSSLPGVALRFPVESNGVFATLPEGLAEALFERGWHFYWFSDADAWRFMCSWSCSDEAIEALVQDARECLADLGV